MTQDVATVLATLALYLAIVVSPGPSFALVSRMAVAGKRRAALGATLGLAAGATVYAVLTMAGLAVMLGQVGWLVRQTKVDGHRAPTIEPGQSSKNSGPSNIGKISLLYRCEYVLIAL